MDRFSLPSWSARNPLGIIALFISLIYGMSALLLGASIGQLAASNQTILVIFIVIFPFVVLGLFAWLVAKHHRKLYGPGDYRSDDSFLSAANTQPPAALGERLRHEVAGGQSTTDEHADEASRAPMEYQSLTKILGTTQKEEALLALSIESLVFQELQRELGTAIKRGVIVTRPNGNTLHVDGVADDGKGAIFIEVKMLRTLSAIKVVLSREPYMYSNIIEELARTWQKAPKLLLALVYLGEDEHPDVSSWINEAQEKTGGDVLIRYYSATELLIKYGFSSQQSGA
jgi:hypothetical protein